MLGNKEISRRFESHEVTDEQGDAMDAARAKFKSLASWIDKNVPGPREAASALTHLEQASFFVIAGIARPEAEQPKAAKAPRAAAPTEEPKVDGRSKAARAAKAAAAPAETAPVRRAARRPASK